MIADVSKSERFARRGRQRPGGVSHAFTLIEVVVVVIILGLLVALVAPRVVEHVGDSRVQTTEAQILMLEQSVNDFRLDMGRPPTEEEGLAVLLARPGGDGDDAWDGPYVERNELPTDGWGNAFEYDFDEHGRFVIRSLGSDGRPGGEGEQADLDNRSL